ncbi:hypothetical protein DV515_00003270, partial [Chloebia gouldiae]
EFLHSKTSELLNRLDVGLPKNDSCQIANPGPKSTAWKRSHAYKQALRDDENKRLEEMRQEQQRKAELLEFKQKQEEETRTRSLKNEQRRSQTTWNKGGARVLQKYSLLSGLGQTTS